MNRKTTLGWASLAAAAVIAAVLWRPQPPDAKAPGVTVRPAPSSAGTPHPSAIYPGPASRTAAPSNPAEAPAAASGGPAAASSAITASAVLPPGANVSARPAAPSVQAAMIDLDKAQHMVHDYHTLMGENPVGTNAEIMKALMGGNPRQAVLGPIDGLQLNGKGELVDPWGTPYFFHQLSGDHMEIHSAGPDKIMGTSDDLVVR